MTDLARRLGRLVAASDSESDADLLGRFVADRDGPALVRRHGPMVLAVCRRVLRHRQDAEDAFQAAFLVLARRAGAVQPRALLGNWLYGVAYRTALAARRTAAARRAREAEVAMRVDAAPADAGLSPELREALDRELAALPGVYRAAVVACELEGLSRRDAAARLGWTEGTLSSRLARARSLLARRLARYGLAVPVAGLAAVAGPAAVGAGLAEPTVRLAVLVAAGEAVVAAPVAALMEAAMKAMFLTKLKALTAALVVGCAVAVTSLAGWRADAVTAADPPKVADAPKRAVPNPDKERIAELERERDRLLKQVAELQDRLAKVEYERQVAVNAAKVAAERDAARAAELKARPAGADPRTPPPKAPTFKNPLDDYVPPSTAATPPSSYAPIPAPASNRPAVVSPPPRTELTPPGSYTPVPAPASDLPPLHTPAPAPAAAAKAVVRVYPVGDLAGDEKEGDALAKVLRAVVEPKSWGADAGVEYLPGRKVLVVRQTEAGHDEVAKLLKTLQVQSAPGKK